MAALREDVDTGQPSIVSPLFALGVKWCVDH
jgi:hypothetical protein